MRAPDGDHGDPPADPPADPPSLVSGDPPADPPAGPPAGGPPADEPPVVEPITLESLTLPEGLEIPEAVSGELLEILNGDQSPQDRANALLALHAKTMSEALEADSKAWDTVQKEWRDTAKADTEIGGDKLQPALNNIGKLLDEFGNEELRGVFDLTGAGNNVHVIKFLNKIAPAVVVVVAVTQRIPR